MNTFLLLTSIGLALATPFEIEVEAGADFFPIETDIKAGADFLIAKKYPEIITKIDQHDYSNFSTVELLAEASHHAGLEFLNDAEVAASMGIDLMNLDPELIEDALSTTCEVVIRRGYECEIHRIQTSDRYILELHRISGGPTHPPRQGKRVALLQHGLLDSSATWVIMGVRSGLGFILSDLGYDVWLGNVRGNRYSRQHLDHDPDGGRGNRRRFWDFSWHQMGTIDLPTMIDHITSVTGEQRIHYVGHSQGTTSLFVMLSQRPHFNDRLISAHALAPIAFMGRLFSPFVRAAAMFQNTIDFGAGVLGIYEFLPNSDTMARLGQAACRDQAFFQSMCTNVLFLIGGFNSDQMNSTMLPVILGHTPAGASTDQLVHYAQSIRSNRFRQFDFGAISNLFTYGSLSPPRYPLENIRAPISLYYSMNDWLADPRDVTELFNGIPNGNKRLVRIIDPRFNHFDFIWAIDVVPLLYNDVIAEMRAREN